MRATNAGGKNASLEGLDDLAAEWIRLDREHRAAAAAVAAHRAGRAARADRDLWYAEYRALNEGAWGSAAARSDAGRALALAALAARGVSVREDVPTPAWEPFAVRLTTCLLRVAPFAEDEQLDHSDPGLSVVFDDELVALR